MMMIRPAVRDAMFRARELIMALAVTAAAIWLFLQGGWLLEGIGVILALLGLGWAVYALRRMRFATTGDAPGLVEVDEGRITYFGPQVGGDVGLPDLVELRLITMRGRRLWRLKQADGQALLIPVEAAGAERLFDAFASLPGMDTGALVQALTPPATAAGGTALAADAQAIVIWRRSGRGIVGG